MPLISVITATYNALDGLRRTVESVREQTLDDIEHVIVDGGSTDGTVEYLRSLGDAVRWISEPDEGIADAMNKGVAMARGEYVLVLQAADRFLGSDSAALVAPLLTADLVYFDVMFGDRREPARTTGRLTSFMMTQCHQGMFVRRSLFDRVGLFDTSFKISMDYDWILRARRHQPTEAAHRQAITYMDPDGVSSNPAWAGVGRRMTETRRAQTRNLSGIADRFVHEAFWAAYLPYKFAIVKFRQLTSQ